MAAKKLSEIVQGNPGSNDFVVGVTSTNQDRLFPVGEMGFGSGRTKLLADFQYYVSTTGSNSNDGLTLLTAFATLQHANDVLTNTIDLNGFHGNINVSPGTYAGISQIGGYYSSKSSALLHTNGVIQYNGDLTTPTNVVITSTLSRDGRHVCWQSDQSSPREVDTSFDGFDWNVFDSGLSFGPIVVAETSDIITIGQNGGNSQIDCGTTGVPMFSGSIVFGPGTILINGAASGFASSSTSNVYATSTQGFATPGTTAFMQGSVNITGNPALGGLWSIFSSSLLNNSFNAGFTGAFTGSAFACGEHSIMSMVGNDWNTGAPVFGTPSVTPPTLYEGGIYSNNFFNRRFEATGAQIFGASKNYSQPGSGFSLTLGLADTIVILDPAGALATGTITMMPAMDQMRVSIRSTQTVTALTLSPGAGQSMAANTPTTISAGHIIDLIFQASNSTWYSGI